MKEERLLATESQRRKDRLRMWSKNETESDAVHKSK
jgi:hypothetical protein